MSHVSIISAAAAATDRTGFPCHARATSIMQRKQAPKTERALKPGEKNRAPREGCAVALVASKGSSDIV